MSKRKKTDYAPHIPPEAAPTCHVEGCDERGTYKAPKSKDLLHEYQWLCLDHIREHNQKWDYFSDMDSDEIEHFRRDAVTGHRPTWTRESRIGSKYEKLQDALYEFMNFGAKKPAAPIPPLTAKLRKALSVLDMPYPFTARQLKIQYRMLVKKHHPDVNKGNKESEEAFKEVTTAYHTLSEHLRTM